MNDKKVKRKEWNIRKKKKKWKERERKRRKK